MSKRWTFGVVSAVLIALLAGLLWAAGAQPMGVSFGALSASLMAVAFIGRQRQG